MVHIGRVVHQHAKLTVQSFIHRVIKAQPGLGHISRVDLHPTKVQMVQPILPQGVFEALLCALLRVFPDQTGNFGRPPLQQRFNNVHTEKAVCTGDNHLVNITQLADGQCRQRRICIGIQQSLRTDGVSRSAVAVDQAGQCQHGRCFDETVDRDTAPEPLANAQQQA